jgi:hypothetical protein
MPLRSGATSQKEFPSLSRFPRTKGSPSVFAKPRSSTFVQSFRNCPSGSIPTSFCVSRRKHSADCRRNEGSPMYGHRIVHSSITSIAERSRRGTKYGSPPTCSHVQRAPGAGRVSAIRECVNIRYRFASFVLVFGWSRAFCAHRLYG